MRKKNKPKQQRVRALVLSLCLLARDEENNVFVTFAAQDPCRHGGQCISTDSGPLCDCDHIDFSGVFCEKGKQGHEHGTLTEREGSVRHYH